MFIHKHPYPPFFPKNVTKVIVGTLPPPRFSIGMLKEGDVDFCYGSRDGLLWPILDRIFSLNLRYDSSEAAIKQRKDFLQDHHIGICDIVSSCERDKIDASDMGMKHIVLRNLIGYIHEHAQIETIIFTGGNSKNGPEFLFRRHLKDHQIKLHQISSVVPRVHEFKLDNSSRVIKTVSLTAPSGSANRAVGSMEYYKMRKARNPNFNTLDFRVEQYAPIFK